LVASSSRPNEPTRGADSAASRGLWLLNIALGSLIGLAYLESFELDSAPRLWVFAHFGLVSAVATFSLLPAACIAALRRTRLGPRVVRGGEVALWTLFQLALLVDTRVWGLFRYHFGAAAWNLVTSKGAEDSYRLGPKVWLFAAGAAALIAFVNLAALSLASSRRRSEVNKRVEEGGPRFFRPVFRPGAMALAGLILIVVVEKTIYARADLDRDSRVVAVSEALPLYPRLRVSSILPDGVREAWPASPIVRVSAADAVLDHPRTVFELDADGPRPNVLVVVIDSWRRDMLDEQVTPHMAEFARDARRFDDHLSTGNGTRFGVFGMLYGLHGSYWWPVLEARRAPPLLLSLAAAGYELRVLSSASMDYPEFRSTAWVECPDAVWDDFGEAPSSVRDQRVAARFEQWLDERSATPPGERAPFFAFVLLDSAHQKYDFPPEHAVFTPYAWDLDYVELSGSRDPELAELVRNRYRNGLHHADAIAARVVEALRSRGELESTLVVITGDHGEEFAENGYWGHTGNFTLEQVATPLLLRGPGVERGVETRPTSHIDLSGTLLELLGADAARVRETCFSRSLLDPPERRARVVAGWEEVGLWTEDCVFRIPRDETRGLPPTACDARWTPLEDQHAAFARHSASLEQLSLDCLRFLRAAP
jgi:membrane-anchored protein YejM (alkaline phosphatase superfamily)